ncbi:hypothetical protein TeGR_g9834 [Tetraparma gracilis]|uniref:Uncharacterized protein n=1 Tax=Tetraparma gracilis TaxID=2962635 RepID=A0ABQ6MIB4_9STRA|nr:hypothetical protein TeGR_g9834 [Tetraparma gracilis]
MAPPLPPSFIVLLTALHAALHPGAYTKKQTAGPAFDHCLAALVAAQDDLPPEHPCKLKDESQLKNTIKSFLLYLVPGRKEAKAEADRLRAPAKAEADRLKYLKPGVKEAKVEASRLNSLKPGAKESKAEYDALPRVKAKKKLNEELPHVVERRSTAKKERDEAKAAAALGMSPLRYPIYSILRANIDDLCEAVEQPKLPGVRKALSTMDPLMYGCCDTAHNDKGSMSGEGVRSFAVYLPGKDDTGSWFSVYMVKNGVNL